MVPPNAKATSACDLTIRSNVRVRSLLEVAIPRRLRVDGEAKADDDSRPAVARRWLSIPMARKPVLRKRESSATALFHSELLREIEAQTGVVYDLKL